MHGLQYDSIYSMIDSGIKHGLISGLTEVVVEDTTQSKDYSIETMTSVQETVPEFGEDIRKEFMLREKSVFLNHGSYGSMPRCVHEKQVRYVKVNCYSGGKCKCKTRFGTCLYIQ